MLRSKLAVWRQFIPFDWLRELLILISFPQMMWDGKVISCILANPRRGMAMDQLSSQSLMTHSTSEIEEPEDSKFLELWDVIQGSWRCPDPQSDNAFHWIESAYRMSRGFELGTFHQYLLPISSQEQFKNWNRLILGYISNVKQAVHSFMNDLSSALCPDPRVGSNLWTLITDELLKRYEKAVSHTHFIFRVERKDISLIINHCWTIIYQRLESRDWKASCKIKLSRSRLTMNNEMWWRWMQSSTLSKRATQSTGWKTFTRSSNLITKSLASASLMWSAAKQQIHCPVTGSESPFKIVYALFHASLESESSECDCWKGTSFRRGHGVSWYMKHNIWKLERSCSEAEWATPVGG